MSSDWLGVAASWHGSNFAFVIVTVLGVAGSAPAEAGRRMLVAADKTHGTIGGGRLEQEAIDAARRWLGGAATPKLSALALGSKLGQCCGGKVVVHYEKVVPAAVAVAVFGAGHVGQELVGLLRRLPYELSCHDTRPQWLALLDHNVVAAKHAPDEEALLEAARALRPGTWCVVMTHSHQLDLALARELLGAAHHPFVGVIGSKSKGTRFRRELAGRGLDLACFHCPIGVAAGKQPAEVALMIASELCQRIHADDGAGAGAAKAATRLLAQLAKDAASATD